MEENALANANKSLLLKRKINKVLCVCVCRQSDFLFDDDNTRETHVEDQL